MGNWIYFDQPASPGMEFHGSPQRTTTDAIGKISQLIPGPVLGAYGAALGTLPLFTLVQQPWVGLVLFLLGIGATGWLVAWQMDRRLRKARHVVVYALAFAVWAYSLTGKVALPWIYHPGVGALLPILAAFVFYQTPLPRVQVR